MTTDRVALAIKAHQENRIGDAVEQYQAILKDQPGSAEIWYAYGMLLHAKLGDLKGAEQCFRNSLALSPGFAQGSLQLGILLAQQDMASEALPYLRVAADEKLERGYAELVCALFRLGKLDQAEATARTYMARLGTSFFSSYLLAWVLTAKGNYREALQHAGDSVLQDPGYPIPLGFQALLLWRLGKQVESRRVVQEMAASHADKVAQSWGVQKHKEATDYWRQLRGEIKAKLGLGEKYPVNVINLFGGLGDQYFIASILKAFRRQNPGYPLVVLADHSAHWEAIYPDAADMFFHIDKDKSGLLVGCNRMFPDHPYTPFFPWIGPLVSLFSLREFSKCFMGIPYAEEDGPPVFSENLLAEARARLTSLGGIEGRSVLVGPVSNSNPMMPVQWWEACVAHLRSRGLVVFQNTKNMWNPAPIDALSGAIPIDLPLELAIPFCNLAGHYVGVRNGLCDLLLYASARMKTLHVRRRYATNDKYPLSVWLDYRSGYSLQKCSESANWQDLDIGAGDTFDPELFADWTDILRVPEAEPVDNA